MQTDIMKDDIRDLFAGFVVAIELDQLRVDALPPEAFLDDYSDNTWRIWRRCHLEYLSLLLSTVDEIQPVTLEKLTWIATNNDPKFVGERLLDVLGAASADSVPREDVATAELFLKMLIQDVSGRTEGRSIAQDASTLMKRWLRDTDPLHIARDPECGYGPYLGGYAAS
ncbi:hypothetical protein [Bradyrhizobium arachidis]|uniref:Uncharacterized protein n=1 Tax=Bradyrhizobium arachidis TaxID=858423 RepID=A0AAE7NV26_9BRAD|nr:hypothetical protein [Bradyrhizobium arachidis]QOZ71732.1 hypothetical protein WN72_39645 [Bradyrhizobium arachidis]SFV19140.1 hypothetical protein SAMN05192541_14616 [Bradyrhizobium arachidis]